MTDITKRPTPETDETREPRDALREMLEHILNCFSTANQLEASQSPVEGQISIQTFNKARTLLSQLPPQ